MKIEEILLALPQESTGRHIHDVCASLERPQSERSFATQLAETLVQYELIEEVAHLTYRRLREEVRGTMTLNARGFGFVRVELGDAPIEACPSLARPSRPPRAREREGRSASRGILQL